MKARRFVIAFLVCCAAALSACGGEFSPTSTGRVSAKYSAGEFHYVAGVWVTDNQQIRMHRIQCQRCIDQRLSLFKGGGLHRHIHYIRAQAFAGQFETGLCAGGRLEEHIDLGEARQSIGMLV